MILGSRSHIATDHIYITGLLTSWIASRVRGIPLHLAGRYSHNKRIGCLW